MLIHIAIQSVSQHYTYSLAIAKNCTNY